MILGLSLVDLVALAPELVLASTALLLWLVDAWWLAWRAGLLRHAPVVACVVMMAGVWYGGHAWITGEHTGRAGNPVFFEMVALVATTWLVLLADFRDRVTASSHAPRWLPCTILWIGLSLATWHVFGTARGFDGGVMQPVIALGEEGDDQWMRLDAFAFVGRSLLLLVGFVASLSLWSDGGPRSNRCRDAAALAAAILTSSFAVMTENVVVLGASFTLIVVCVSLGCLGGRVRREGVETALKVFASGVVAIALTLLGATILHGFGGGLSLDAIGIGFEELAATDATRLLAGFAWIAFFAGPLWLMAATPFHFHAPDSAQAAPSGLALFLAIGCKVVGVAVILRALMASSGASVWAPGFVDVFALVAVATMALGNLAALRQESLRRCLGYVSIAQAGVILAGVAAFYSFEYETDGSILSSHASDEATAAILMNVAIYAISIAGLVSTLRSCMPQSADHIDSAEPNAAHALCAGLFVLTLVGLPPTSGFVARLELCRVIGMRPGLTWLVVAVVASFVLSSLYLLPVLRRLFAAACRDGRAVARPESRLHFVVMLCLALITLWLWVAPTAAIELVKAAALGLRL